MEREDGKLSYESIPVRHAPPAWSISCLDSAQCRSTIRSQMMLKPGVLDIPLAQELQVLSLQMQLPASSKLGEVLAM